MIERISSFILFLSVRQALRRARRSLATFVGIVGGLVLAFCQLGIQEALYESSVRIHHVLNGEVVIVPTEFDMMLNPVWFDKNSLSAVAAQPIIAGLTYLSTMSPMVRGVNGGKAQPLLIIAVDPYSPAIDMDKIGADVKAIQVPGQALWDRRSRHHWGDVSGLLKRNGHVELSTATASLPTQFPIEVVGTYSLGGSIVALGSIMVSPDTFQEIGGQGEDRPNLAVVRLAPGIFPDDAATLFNRMLPDTVRAVTVSRLIEDEKTFWSSETPIGFFMNFTAAIGVVICTIFVAQALIQTVDENLSEYAVLRTLDVPDYAFMIGVVLTGVILVLAAMPLAAAASLILYQMAILATDLPFDMTLQRTLLVAGTASGAAVLAAVITGRRILTADPAKLL